MFGTLQGFRFSVLFLKNKLIPMVLDMRFSKVSGLSVSTGVYTVKAGGQNLFDYRYPDGMKYENLVLTRGMPVVSFLRDPFSDMMDSYKFSKSLVMVFLHDEMGLPMAAWKFENAWPVKWSFSDLDASSGTPVIETMELAYERFSKLL